MSVNPGIWVRQSIASAPASYGKYANVALEKWSFRQMMEEWCRITGHKGEYIPCMPEQWTEIWGPPGTEVSSSGAGRLVCSCDGRECGTDGCV